jgi:CheY-like chemotaxis protein
MDLLAETGRRAERSSVTGPVPDPADIGRAPIGGSPGDLLPFAETEAVRRRLDEFLAMLSHELRNPLAAIAHAGQLLARPRAERPRPEESGRQSPDGEETASLAALIGRQTRHLGRLVDDLLDVSRFTRGLTGIQVAPVELGAVVAGAVEMAQPMIAARRHRLDVSLPAEPLWLEADATRLVQVLGNLLDNAAKFTPPGGRLRLEVERCDTEVAIAVRDNGPGITPELLPHVFDLFVQADRSLARSHGGLGIGLTLVRSLVEMHGGRVSAASDGQGHGTEITIRLPLAGSLAAAGLPSSSDPRPSGPDSGGPDASALPGGGLGPGARHASDPRATLVVSRVLLVEDNLDAAEPLTDLLRMWGHEVVMSHDGPSALIAARNLQPDVVLLDIGLPGMDGYQLAQALRALPELSSTRFIAITGYGQLSDRLRSRQAGFDHHLVKPVDLQELQRLVAH